MKFERKVPSLTELCKDTIIANLRYIADVGEMDIYLLKDILPHCSVEQLTRIENATKGRDLSPVTDVVWKKFYEREFGAESVEMVVRRMKQKGVVFKWKLLFEAKTKERQEAQNKIAQKLKLRYAESLAKKQSRQIQLCSKVPPSTKRGFWGGSCPSSGPSSSVGHLKGNLMKKAKLEYLNSHEARIHATIRKNAVQRTSSSYRSVSSSSKLSSFTPKKEESKF